MGAGKECRMNSQRLTQKSISPSSRETPRTRTGRFIRLWLEHGWTLVPINLVYTLLNLTVLAGGLAAVGMAAVARDLDVDGYGDALGDYFRAIKQNWRQGFAAGLVHLLIGAFLLAVTAFYATSSGVLAVMGLGCSLAAGVIYAFTQHYFWTLLVTCRQSAREAMKNSVLLVFLNWRRGLQAGLVLAAYYAVMIGAIVLIPHSLTAFLVALVSVCVFPGFRALLVQTCVFPAIRKYVIDPYYQEHPDEDVIKRKNLESENMKGGM